MQGVVGARHAQEKRLLVQLRNPRRQAQEGRRPRLQQQQRVVATATHRQRRREISCWRQRSLAGQRRHLRRFPHRA
eukprot:437064-Pyramimonas_sp.AAC.1